jgi:hypothetical protein
MAQGLTHADSGVDSSQANGTRLTDRENERLHFWT